VALIDTVSDDGPRTSLSPLGCFVIPRFGIGSTAIEHSRGDWAGSHIWMACVFSLWAPLFVPGTQHLPSFRVHQMRLCARKARHLDVGDFVFGIISGPSLVVVAVVGAMVEERRQC
jgi:hypothetical protein